ncbi:MAG: hypothetical protein ACO3C1_06155 [Ilumatobacteraceae bacterium]
MRARLIVPAATAAMTAVALLAVLVPGVDGGLSHVAAAGTEPAPEPSVEGTITPVTGSIGTGGETDVPAEPGGVPGAAGPLILVPAGCATPPPAVAVFDGVVTDVSVDSARFEVVRLLAGSLNRYETVPGVVDVVYGEETRFLEVGERYIVGARSDETRLLYSAVGDPRPLFGGDAVIGLNDSDIDCPHVDDPVRTLLPDGTPVDASLLTPLHGARSQLLRALVLPVGVALAVLLALVLVKHLVFAFGRALRDSIEPDVY